MTKKRTFSIFFLLVAAIFSMFAFTACNKDDPDESTHTPPTQSSFVGTWEFESITGTVMDESYNVLNSQTYNLGDMGQHGGILTKDYYVLNLLDDGTANDNQDGQIKTGTWILNESTVTLTRSDQSVATITLSNNKLIVVNDTNAGNMIVRESVVLTKR